MKKTIYTIIIVLIISFILGFSLNASEFYYEKINEFAFAQSFIGESYFLYPYIYALTEHGLEIYKISSQNNIQKVSVLTIRDPSSLLINENYAYISSNQGLNSSQTQSCIFQVSLNNLYDPSIIDTIEISNDLGVFNMQIYNEQLYYYLSEGYGLAENCVYSLPDLNFLGNLPTSIKLKKVNDSLAINIFNWEIYKATDLTNLQLLGVVDDPGYSPSNIETISDTIITISTQNLVSFWDISDNSNWEYITEYYSQEMMIKKNNMVISDNYLILICFGYLELIDIVDPYNPQQSNIIQTNVNDKITNNVSGAISNNNLILCTREDGLLKYTLNKRNITYDFNYFEYPQFYSSYIYSHYIFIQTWRYGIYCFDISDPMNPIEVPTSLKNPNYHKMICQENLIIVRTNENCYKIYDISNPIEPTIQNTLDSCYFNTLKFDGSCTNKVYQFHYYPTRIKKYDITEVGIVNLLFDYSPTLEGVSFVVKNGYGYISEEQVYSNNLYILYGLENNNPFIINQIPDFIQDNNELSLDFCHSYLVGKIGFETPYFFNIMDPLEPELIFNIDIPYFTGRICSYNDLIFASDLIDIYIYDITTNKKDCISYINYLGFYSFITDFEFLNTRTKNYLFTVEYSVIEVFEFSYNSINNNAPAEKISITNYPNPFSTSTTISFNSKKPINKNTKIEIYNIKGQKVRSLALTENEISENANLSYSVNWNCKNKNNNEVAPGIYFCKIKTAENTFVSKMLRLE